MARRQADLIRDALAAQVPAVRWDVVAVASAGDQQPDVPLASFGGEGVFVKALEQALLQGDIDLAVHSLKDVPLTGSPAELVIAAVPPRETPYDALVSRASQHWAALPQGARVGTSSIRRQSQLYASRRDVTIEPLRGNLDTRLRKLETDGLDAVVVAAAGLHRLGLQTRITEVLTMLVPEPGQGALAIQVRREDRGLRELVERLDDRASRVAVEAERALLGALGGGCRVPIGALATVQGDVVRLQGLVASPDGQRVVRDEMSGPATDAVTLGERLARQLITRGAREILASVTR